MEEIEVKFLDIDPLEMEKKILDLGGVKIFDRLFKRRVFDYPDLRLNAQGAFLRVRDEGDKITLGYKQRIGIGQKGENDKGMEEIEVVVSDFNKTCELILAFGFIEKFYVENRRISYQYNGVELDIDFRPLIEPCLEIEADSWDKVDTTITKLGLDPKDKKIFTAFQIYEMNGINELDYEVLTFEKQIKRKNGLDSGSSPE